MEPFLLPVFVTTAIKKITDFVAFVTAKDWKAVIKQVVAWVTGVLAVAAVKAAGFADDFVLPGLNQALADVNVYGTAIIGFILASAAGVTADFIASRDNTSSAYVPPIGGPPKPDPPA